MTTNEGTLDRAVRLAVGLALVGFAEAGTIGAWGYIGIVPLLTATFGWCPLYSLLGINTCSLGKA